MLQADFTGAKNNAVKIGREVMTKLSETVCGHVPERRDSNGTVLYSRETNLCHCPDVKKNSKGRYVGCKNVVKSK